MRSSTVVNFAITFFVLQLHFLDSNQNPTQVVTGNTLTIEEENVNYIEPVPQNKTSFYINFETTTDANNESYQLETAEALQKLRQQIILVKRTQIRIFALNPEDMLFMFTSLMLLCFHLFFMDMFIRLTRTRFQGHSRYRCLSVVHLILAFLIGTVYFLLIMLHYRDSKYCG